MLPDRVSNPGPLTYESGALPIALRGRQLFNLCKCIGNIAVPCLAVSCAKKGLSELFIGAMSKDNHSPRRAIIHHG